MSTGYGREGLRQVCTTVIGARHVPDRLCGGSVCSGMNVLFLLEVPVVIRFSIS